MLSQVASTAHVMQDVRNVLAAIPYNENDVWLHTDATLMPRNRTAWASWNFLGRCTSMSESCWHAELHMHWHHRQLSATCSSTPAHCRQICCPLYAARPAAASTPRCASATG